MCFDGLPSCSSFAFDQGPFRPAKQDTCTARRRILHEDPTVCAKLGCAQGVGHTVTQNILEKLVDVLNGRRHLAVFDRAESYWPSREHLTLHQLLEVLTMIFHALRQMCNTLSHDQADMHSSNCPFGRAVSSRVCFADFFLSGMNPKTSSRNCTQLGKLSGSVCVHRKCHCKMCR